MSPSGMPAQSAKVSHLAVWPRPKSSRGAPAPASHWVRVLPPAFSSLGLSLPARRRAAELLDELAGMRGKRVDASHDEGEPASGPRVVERNGTDPHAACAPTGSGFRHHRDPHAPLDQAGDRVEAAEANAKAQR